MKNNNLKLDNAAKIYPAAMTKDWNSVFRAAIYLNEDVCRAVLARAVKELAPRFPSFYVQLHEGGLWDSFIPAENFDIVFRDMYGICNPFPVGRGHMPLFRVLYKDNMIAAEFFHAVTDGSGALVYLKTLTARYLELKGAVIEKTNGVLDIDEQAQEYEIEDDFQPLYEKAKRVSRNEDNAYQYKPEREQNLRALTAVASRSSLKTAAEKYGCTVTAYLAGAYAFAFVQHYKTENSGKKMKRAVKISIPVNLRPYFNSKTLRNFSSFVNVSVNPNECNSLGECIFAVKNEMDRLIKIEKIKKTVSQNVAEEKMFITKIAPNKLKKIVMRACFLQFGERKYTSPFSNLGIIDVPSEMKKHVQRFEFVIGKTLLNSVYLTAAGFEENISVTLSAATQETAIDDLFFKALKADGVEYKISEIGKTKKPVRVRENENTKKALKFVSA